MYQLYIQDLCNFQCVVIKYWCWRLVNVIYSEIQLVYDYIHRVCTEERYNCVAPSNSDQSETRIKIGYFRWQASTLRALTKMHKYLSILTIDFELTINLMALRNVICIITSSILYKGRVHTTVYVRIRRLTQRTHRCDY